MPDVSSNITVTVAPLKIPFNPGLAQSMERLEEFTDVRDIQKQLKAAGIQLELEADEETTGPAHISILDPDGNAILIDQFF